MKFRPLFATAVMLASMAPSPGHSDDSGVSIAPIAAQEVALGSSRPIPLTVTANPDFSGKIVFKIDASSLPADAKATVAVSVSPASVTVAQGKAASAVLTIKTDTSALPFDGASITLVAETGSGRVTQNVSLSVKAVYDIDVLPGTGKCKFEFSSPVEPAVIRADGVNMRFHNLSNDEVIIHGDNSPIPHMPHFGPTQPPLKPATVDASGKATVAAGGTYETGPIKLGATDLKSNYTTHDFYCPNRYVIFKAN